MSNVKLLDCTLRDGGYVNKWSFGKNVIMAVTSKLSQAGIDIIEVGFLSDMPHTENDSLYGSCAEIDMIVQSKNASKIAAMIAIGEMELNPEKLASAEDSLLDIVRITFHNSKPEIQKAIRFARCLMEKGYEVFFQPVGTTAYTDQELLELISVTNELKPNAFYLVDTLGLLQHRELLHYIDIIDHNLDPEIMLGFHSHNNLQMSYSNAQFIAEYNTNRKFIIDCSVYGMGRGAGNLCTELITQYLNGTESHHYELPPIFEILDDNISPILANYSWGYNAHYCIAAFHKCHPNYASFLMNKQTLTMNEVNMILKSIPEEERAIFQKPLVERLYRDFQTRYIEDSNARKTLFDELNGRVVLLLAPGKSISVYKDAIRQFIAEKSPVVISINVTQDDFLCDYIFISNIKRLNMLDASKIKIPAILTSNLPEKIDGSIYVNYTSLCTQDAEPDNSGMMLLRLMNAIGIKRVYVAGYDGFGYVEKDNYSNDSLITGLDFEGIEKKNKSISKQLQALQKEMEIIMLTPSKYIEEEHVV